MIVVSLIISSLTLSWLYTHLAACTLAVMMFFFLVFFFVDLVEAISLLLTGESSASLPQQIYEYLLLCTVRSSAGHWQR